MTRSAEESMAAGTHERLRKRHKRRYPTPWRMSSQLEMQNNYIYRFFNNLINLKPFSKKQENRRLRAFSKKNAFILERMKAFHLNHIQSKFVMMEKTK
jgi:hypothetical protein